MLCEVGRKLNDEVPGELSSIINVNEVLLNSVVLVSVAFGWTVARGYSDIPCMSGVFLADGPLKVQMFCI